MKSLKVFGGELQKGRRKAARPLSTRHALHIVLRAKTHCLRKQESRILKCIDQRACKWGLRIYKVAVVSNHLHLCLKIPSRADYRHFIQAITGTIAKRLGSKIWLYRPWSRIIEWGRDFENCKAYVHKNWLEAHGLIKYERSGKRANVPDP